MEETKKWYRSKTLWVNLGTIVTTVGAIMMGEIALGSGMGAIALAVVNIGLRIVTGKPVSS